jgi:ATP-dependent DNA helicase RecG
MKKIEILERLRRIIESLIKNDFALLPKTKHLEKTLLTLLSSANDLPEGFREELKKLFYGFDTLTLPEKKDRILRAKALLEDFAQGKYEPLQINELPDVNTFPTLDEYRLSREVLERSIDTVKGIGPKLAKKFAKKDVYTIEDLLYFIPRDYQDRRKVTPISELVEGESLIVYGEIIKSGPSHYGRRNVYEVVITDGSGYLYLKWFNFNEGLWRKLYPLSKRIYAYGEVSRFGRNFEMIHPEVVGDEEEEKLTLEIGKIVPVYSSMEGVSNKVLRKILKNALEEYLPYIPNLIPSKYLKKAGYLPLRTALEKLHAPDDNADIISLRDGRSIYHKSLAFEEFFFLELALGWRKGKLKEESGIAFNVQSKLVEEFLAKLPFELTNAQKRVFEEIKQDMARPVPMNRLLQGDVGCGKTVIAFLASLIAIENGYQVALMAPTEILAEQHYYNFRQYNQLLGLNVALLTGGTPPSRKREIYHGLKTGYIQLVIGTHALFQEAVEFRRLGLVIIDEQHRFGVLQRAELRAKAKDLTPDTLVMTATPIPRTLALTIYGDLDVSIIDEMPKGRKPVITKLFLEHNKDLAYELVKAELKKGHQAYVILPLIEESEALDLKAVLTYGEELKKRVFPEFKVEILHGKMSSHEKERIMQAFKRGEINILVSTTVVEVGVDVPNATVMVIEHAERFGLSQLHQLRGRVGRSDKQSYCFLIAYKIGLGSEAFKRLEVLTKTTDGFKIAEEDLKLRGPGEFLGTKQSGYLEFRRADLVRDYDVLLKARECAFDLIKEDPELKKYAVIKEELFRRWKDRLKLLEVA